MGRSFAVTTVVECTLAGGKRAMTNMEWRTGPRGQIPGYGKPTAANLAKFVAKLNESFRPGGVNAHCGPEQVVAARIVRYGETLATFNAEPALAAA